MAAMNSELTDRVEVLKPENPEEPIDLSSGRFLNESAMRSHALRCSARFKGNRFTRVGQDFLDEVSADVEMLIRNIRNHSPTAVFPPLEPDEKTSCITGALCDKVATELNRLICRMIQQKTQRQPSCGKTLRATR
jgi:hypothetical protein